MSVYVTVHVVLRWPDTSWCSLYLAYCLGFGNENTKKKKKTEGKKALSTSSKRTDAGLEYMALTLVWQQVAHHDVNIWEKLHEKMEAHNLLYDPLWGGRLCVSVSSIKNPKAFVKRTFFFFTPCKCFAVPRQSNKVWCDNANRKSKHTEMLRDEAESWWQCDPALVSPTGSDASWAGLMAVHRSNVLVPVEQISQILWMILTSCRWWRRTNSHMNLTDWEQSRESTVNWLQLVPLKSFAAFLHCLC